LPKTRAIRLISENNTVGLLSLWNGVKIKNPNMRKVIFSIANSLDNYIARKDGAVGWLLFILTG